VGRDARPIFADGVVGAAGVRLRFGALGHYFVRPRSRRGDAPDADSVGAYSDDGIDGNAHWHANADQYSDQHGGSDPDGRTARNRNANDHPHGNGGGDRDAHANRYTDGYGDRESVADGD
jgi:hypothetical protein